MKTFEEWWVYPVPVSYDEQEEFHAARMAWQAARRAWQACAAEYQPRIDELKAAIEAAVMAERKMWQGRESEGYRQHLLQRVTDADAIIDEARKLAEEWNREVTGGEYSDLLRCSDQLIAVLDRSGARGGSVAASPAPSPDNQPTNTDRSRT